MPGKTKPAALRSGLLQILLTCAGIMALVVSATGAGSSQKDKTPFADKFKRGFVFDERLSAIRTAPDTQSPIKQRARRGHILYLLESHRDKNGVLFYRVAVTRRTRGWIIAEAVAFPGRPKDDARVMALAEATSDIERLSLCHLLLERFPQSSLRPRALLLFGSEADVIASKVLKRATRRMSDEEKLIANGIPRGYYFLNDVGLDRYNRLGARFDYDEAADEYYYAGDTYREILRRYPNSDAAVTARGQLAKIELRQGANKKAVTK